MKELKSYESVSHNWGDDGIDFAGISQAACFIGRGLRRWGRVPVRDYKEKYGTARVYLDFGIRDLHSFIWPGWAACQWGRFFPKPIQKWLWSLDIYFWPKLFNPFQRIICKYHAWLYGWFYRKAIQKWPHLENEIMSDCDEPELVGYKSNWVSVGNEENQN